MNNSTEPRARHSGFLRSPRLLWLIALSILLAACGSSVSARTSASKPNLKDVSVASPVIMWEPGDVQPLYYDNGHNVWARYHLKPKLIEGVAGTAELSALASGSADMGLFGIGPWISGLAHGVNMPAIMPLVSPSKLEGLYVSPTSGIHNLADLVGKTIAVPFGSSADEGLRFSLSKDNIPITQVHIVNEAPNVLLTAMLRGSISAAYIWSTWGERLLAAGDRLVMTNYSAGVHVGPTILAVTHAYLSAHPGVVARVIAAFNVGNIEVRKDPASVAEPMAKAVGDTYAEALTIAKTEALFTIQQALNPSLPDNFVSYKSGLGSLLPKVVKILESESSVTAAPSDLSSYVDPGPLRAALKLPVVLK